MATWWEILTKDRQLKGFKYDENHPLYKSRNSDDASWAVLVTVLEQASGVPLHNVSGEARKWLETHGPK